MDLISLIVAIVALYASCFYGEKQISQSDFNTFRDYLKGIASSLTEMVNLLRNDEVPTTAGKNLETALEDFEKLSNSLNVSAKTRQRLTEFHSRLKQHLSDGIFLDDVIRGNILLMDKKVKEEKLLEMSRTAGYLQGAAMALKPEDDEHY